MAAAFTFFSNGITQTSSISIDGTEFFANIAGTRGGGVWVSDHSALTITNALFQRNTANKDMGGGLYTGSPTLISNTQFISNVAPQSRRRSLFLSFCIAE